MGCGLAPNIYLLIIFRVVQAIGGGAFLVHYAAKTKAIEVYDGRETAPAAARPAPAATCAAVCPGCV